MSVASGTLEALKGLGRGGQTDVGGHDPTRLPARAARSCKSRIRAPGRACLQDPSCDDGGRPGFFNNGWPLSRYFWQKRVQLPRLRFASADPAVQSALVD